MKKRLLAGLVAVIMIIVILPASALAAGGLSNFSEVRPYTTGQFQDVPTDSWYAEDVRIAYQYGLIDGKQQTPQMLFAPDANLKLSEAIKLAACMHEIYHTGTVTLTNGEAAWYQPYVDYAIANGIIESAYPNYDAYATRSEFALIFAAAIPEEALSPRNTINDDAIPDVQISYEYGPAVYLLYRAGVLTGSDAVTHAYLPNNKIKRSEVAAILTRMTDSDSRKSFTMTTGTSVLTKAQIAQQCAPAVFYIEIYDQFDTFLGTGSGFFISDSGIAVTNYHVIDGASSAIITTEDGGIYDVQGVYDYSVENDLALLQIDGSGFPYLALADSDTIVTGDDIFAIGYPLGIDQTVTAGAITNASHLIDGLEYFMIDASISPGSSGGALLDDHGQVVGVTSASYTYGQNMNLAVPSNLIGALSQGGYTALSTLFPQSNADFYATPSTITVAAGNIETVTITDPSGDPYNSVDLMITDPSIVSCSWGDWINYEDCPLYLRGLTAGTTTVRVNLYDGNDTIIAQTVITVTVTGTAAPTVYYSGYDPAPDWGAFTGTPLYMSYPLSDGSMVYFYRIADISENAYPALYSYAFLLEENGFVYIGSFDNSDGYLVDAYSNDTYYMFLEQVYVNGVLCVSVMVTPL